MSLRFGILAGLTIFGIGLLGVWLFAPSALTEARDLLDGERLEMLVARAGFWGPVLIVALITVAVVASPIPSAPIALAAGAAYGHLWGTVQVVIGAELGALIAFGLARVLGHDVLRRVFGTIKDHTLVYTAVIAGFLTVFFDLSRIASLGAFFYLVMDMIIHLGVFRHLREEIGAQGWVLLTAIALDALVLTAFAAMKWQSDPLIVVVGIGGMALVFLFVGVFLARNPIRGGEHGDHH